MISSSILTFKDRKLSPYWPDGILDLPYIYNTGSFFIYDETVESYVHVTPIPQIRGEQMACNSCREVCANFWWAADHKPRLGFYLYSGLDAERIGAMFTEVHAMLGLPTDQPMVVNRTDTSFIKGPESKTGNASNRAVVLDVPPFWMANGLRRGMLTLFLRAFACYKGNMDEAFRAYPLLTSARPAVDLFLAGHTFPILHYTSNMVSSLQGRTPEQLKRLMVREEVAFDVPALNQASPMPNWAYIQLPAVSVMPQVVMAAPAPQPVERAPETRVYTFTTTNDAAPARAPRVPRAVPRSPLFETIWNTRPKGLKRPVKR